MYLHEYIICTSIRLSMQHVIQNFLPASSVSDILRDTCFLHSCVCVYIYIHTYIHTYMYICIYIHTHVNPRIHTKGCVCVCFLRAHACVTMCGYNKYEYVRMYAIHTHIYIFRQSWISMSDLKVSSKYRKRYVSVYNEYEYIRIYIYIYSGKAGQIWAIKRCLTNIARIERLFKFRGERLPHKGARRRLNSNIHTYIHTYI